jgi:hypothetical protein
MSPYARTLEKEEKNCAETKKIESLGTRCRQTTTDGSERSGKGKKSSLLSELTLFALHISGTRTKSGRGSLESGPEMRHRVSQ